MFRTVCVSIALLASASPSPASSDPMPERQVAIADDQVQTFLAALKAGKQNEAVQALMSSSPLWSKHPGLSEQMAGQIDAAFKAYGPVISYEKISSTNLGTLARREYYMVQHRDMVTRWEFDLVRTSVGWNVGYFGFTDQPNTWFS